MSRIDLRVLFVFGIRFLPPSDGKLEIVVPSFVHYLEVLEGSDGDKHPGMAISFIFFG